MSKPSLRERIGNETLLIDGAWGTQMQARGLPQGESAERWNLERPDDVQAVAAAYIAAGSDAILTNTFCGSRIMLERHGLADQTAEINRRGAEHSRAAAGDDHYVLGSMGPTGELLLMSTYSESDLTDLFQEQADALAEGGVDGFVLETMAALDEVECAATAAARTGLPFILSMVYDSGPQKNRTMMGTAPAEEAETAERLGAVAVGANCGVGIEEVLPILEELSQATSLPLWIKPNAGLPRMENGQSVYDATSEDFAQQAVKCVRRGASCIGGCCGTSPEFIQAIRNAL